MDGGAFKEGMIGRVLRSKSEKDSPVVYVIDVLEAGHYLCTGKDIKLKKDRILKSCSLTTFHNIV